MSTDRPTLLELQAVKDGASCLFSGQQVDEAVAQIATQVAQDLAHLNPLLLCVMNGGLIFTGKILSRLQFPLQVDYLHATRYREKLAGSDLQWKVYPSVALENRHLLILDDILDVGDTLLQIRQYCEGQKAASVRTAVLVEKQHKRRNPLLPHADYTGLLAEDRYLFGSGMDYKGYWRNADGIFAV